MPIVINKKMKCKFPCPSKVTESTYLEIVHFYNGVGTVKYKETGDALLSKGYDYIEEEAEVVIDPASKDTDPVTQDAPLGPPPPPDTVRDPVKEIFA